MRASKILIATAFSACIGCATKEPTGPEAWSSTRTGDRKVERVGMVTATATVLAIDPAKRQITLQPSQGNPVVFIAGDEVRNFDQIKKGDVVTATYYESLVIEAKEPGQAAPGASLAGAAGRAAPGQKPAGVGGREISVTAKVLGIDRTRGTITIQGPEGAVVTVKAQDPKNLEKVKVGDLLEITYTEAIAVSVEKAR